MLKWKLAYEENRNCADKKIRSIADINSSGFECLEATVPGSIELELMKSGKLPDLYFSVNTLEARKIENLHIWYYATFTAEEGDYLHFEGIDTIADIYINGELSAHSENMFIPCDVKNGIKSGENEVVVHIKPVCIESRKYASPTLSNALKYSFPTLYVRKPAHSFGWDIMPRIVSAGLWKEVEIRKAKTEKINELHLMVKNVDLENQKATVKAHINVDALGDFITDYSIRIKGSCGESSFCVEEVLWHNTFQFYFDVENAEFWWPKNAGKPNLYDVTAELICGGEVLDVYSLKFGIRTVSLDISEFTDENAGGEFCFRVNGKKVFILGTNWVPLDASHARDSERLDKALELLDDIGCNMVRCWGGNVYESDRFYEFCDEHGILVWQDFGMGCATYPQDKLFFEKIEEEVIYQVKRLRNHPSIALWAGDNEGDQFCLSGEGLKKDPACSKVTREIVKNAVYVHDYTRPYLPSSPYISERAFKENRPTPEDHLWGPRDYFKSDFYRNALCHFVSETGYQAFPSPKSLERFLANPKKIFNDDGNPTDEYLVHAACMETDPKAPYAYRIRLTHNQVVTLFGEASDDYETLIRQSQISQAEADKYFIERFRIGKWNRTGIMWWNLIDGWPQVSDAIVDYYYVKKLAYSYIKRIQKPVCLMIDEPKGGKAALFGANDLPKNVHIEYTVKEALSGKVRLHGETELCADTTQKIGEVLVDENEQTFLLIEWVIDGRTYKNHYFTNNIGIDYGEYVKAMKKCGFDEFEGF